VLLALLLKIDFLIKGHNKEVQMAVRALGITFIHRKYELRREKVEIYTLYCVDKPKPKRVFSLLDIIKTMEKKKRKPKTNETARGKLFAYINDKSAYHLRFHFDIGLDDAFATAMVCGAVQAAGGAAAALVKDKRHHIKISVRPIFSKRSFSSYTDCIITLSLANIIIGYAMYKINKGR
jgi:hypothetical protein